MIIYTIFMLGAAALQAFLAYVIWPDGPVYLAGSVFMFALWLGTMIHLHIRRTQ